MSRAQRIVHIKQSGEVLSDKVGERWTPTALRKAAERIAEVQRNAADLGVGGLMVVSGGGNVPDGFGRGAVMREKFGADSPIARYADVIGRRSTIDNAIMLSASLADVGVPYLLMAAPETAFSDAELGQVPAYDSATVQAAYRDGKVVLMAGGTGKANQTTDTGVVELAMWQAKAGPKVPSIALKMTKYNGVFETNPAEHADARQYARISAEYMLAHYDALSAVDRQCLEVLRSAGSAGLEVHLQIYAADYTIAQALEDETLGTIITSLPVEPQFVSGQR